MPPMTDGAGGKEGTVGLYETMAKSHPALIQGRVRCETCGRESTVKSAECLRSGWPKCCGYTMTLQPAPKAKP